MENDNATTAVSIRLLQWHAIQEQLDNLMFSSFPFELCSVGQDPACQAGIGMVFIWAMFLLYWMFALLIECH